jgi:hypothetical protein
MVANANAFYPYIGKLWEPKILQNFLLRTPGWIDTVTQDIFVGVQIHGLHRQVTLYHEN